MTGVAKKTVMRILVEIGDVCSEYQDEVFRNLRCKRLQLDRDLDVDLSRTKRFTPLTKCSPSS